MTGLGLICTRRSRDGVGIKSEGTRVRRSSRLLESVRVTSRSTSTSTNNDEGITTTSKTSTRYIGQ